MKPVYSVCLRTVFTVHLHSKHRELLAWSFKSDVQRAGRTMIKWALFPHWCLFWRPEILRALLSIECFAVRRTRNNSFSVQSSIIEWSDGRKLLIIDGYSTDGECPLAVKFPVGKIPKIKKKSISQSTQHIKIKKTEASLFRDN